MKRMLKTTLAAAATVLASTAFADFAPTRPVTITVGFAPGGGTDTAARIIGKKLQDNLGISVVVENRAGAGGNIAAQHIANAQPDGYTIHLTSIGPMTVAPHLMKDLPYDPKKDIAPITMAVIFANVFVVNPDVSARNLTDFVALAKQRAAQGKPLTIASPGIGSAGHLSGELFKQRAGVEMTHVPYKGGGPVMTDLLGGRIDMYPAVPSTALQHIKAGKIHAIATTGLKRAAIMPDVPTVAEQGYPGFEAVNWYAFVAPAKTPKDIIEFWNRELVKALKDPAVKTELDKHGLEPAPSTPEELAKYMDAEYQKWGKVVHDAHITAE